MRVVVSWWTIAIAAYVGFVLSVPRAVSAGCHGWDCIGERGAWWILGMVLGLPTLLLGLLIDSILVTYFQEDAHSGAALGTMVAWSTFGVLAIFFGSAWLMFYAS